MISLIVAPAVVHTEVHTWDIKYFASARRAQCFSLFQLVMSNLQSILENVDTPELLCQSVTCILQVARCYPHIFSINFRVSSPLETHCYNFILDSATGIIAGKKTWLNSTLFFFIIFIIMGFFRLWTSFWTLHILEDVKKHFYFQNRYD